MTNSGKPLDTIITNSESQGSRDKSKEKSKAKSKDNSKGKEQTQQQSERRGSNIAFRGPTVDQRAHQKPRQVRRSSTAAHDQSSTPASGHKLTAAQDQSCTSALDESPASAPGENADPNGKRPAVCPNENTHENRRKSVAFAEQGRRPSSPPVSPTAGLSRKTSNALNPYDHGSSCQQSAVTEFATASPSRNSSTVLGFPSPRTSFERPTLLKTCLPDQSWKFPPLEIKETEEQERDRFISNTTTLSPSQSHLDEGPNERTAEHRKKDGTLPEQRGRAVCGLDGNDGGTKVSEDETNPETLRIQRPADAKLWTPQVLIVSATLSLGAVLIGWGGFSQISGFLGMPEYARRFGDQTKPDGTPALSARRKSLIVGVLTAGAFVASLGAGYVADRIGRKKSTILWALLYLSGAIVEGMAEKHWLQVACPRFVEGLAVGGLSVLIPMYMGEMVPGKLRAIAITGYQVFAALGILLASLLNIVGMRLPPPTPWAWRLTIAIGALWPLLLILCLSWCAESPRWYILQSEPEAAARSLGRIYALAPDDAFVLQDVADLTASINAENAGAQKDERGNPIPMYRRLWSEPTILKRFLIGMMLQTTQQLSGINYFFYYGILLLKDLGYPDPYKMALIPAGLYIIGACAGVFFSWRYGHRTPLLLGGLTICICMIIYSSIGTASFNDHGPLSRTLAGRLMLASSSISLTIFASTWGPLPWLVCAEIFPLRWRALGISTAGATGWALNCVVAFVTSLLTDRIGHRLGFVFAGCVAVGVVGVFFCVTETQGKELEEIDAEIREGRVKPWRSRRGVVGGQGGGLE